MRPWHDWIMVTFARDGEDDTVENVVQQNDEKYFQDDEFPSKFWCFFIIDNKPNVYAIVQFCIAR